MKSTLQDVVEGGIEPVVVEPGVVRRLVISPDLGELVWQVDVHQACPECVGAWARAWFDEPGFPGGWVAAGGICTVCRYVGVGDIVGEWSENSTRPAAAATAGQPGRRAAHVPCHGDASAACVPGLECGRCPLHIGR